MRPATLFTAALSAATVAAAVPHAHANANANANAAAGCARVEVQNVRPQQGHLMVSAFSDEASFGRQPAAARRLPAAEATMRFEVCGLAGPQVALMLFQDLDSNGRMEKNLLGLPLEPWGSSGTPGMTGPNWAGARMPLDGQPLVVRMSQ